MPPAPVPKTRPTPWARLMTLVCTVSRPWLVTAIPSPKPFGVVEMPSTKEASSKRVPPLATSTPTCTLPSTATPWSSPWALSWMFTPRPRPSGPLGSVPATVVRERMHDVFASVA
jgi:hypothetical protein